MNHSGLRSGFRQRSLEHVLADCAVSIVVEKSSNVGMIRIGQRLGKDRLEHYIHAFGFGAPSGVELPGESRGILRPAEGWGPTTLASISFGQEIGVTPLLFLSRTA